MTKAKLFLMAAAPAALIVPIDAYAAAEQVTIVGNGAINSELEAVTSSLPENLQYTFQWYYVDGSTITKIDNGTNQKLQVPEIALGKTIIVQVTDNNGKVYESKKIIVKGNLPINGDNYVNGKLTANIDGVKDPNNPDKKNTFSSYQWYMIDGNTVKSIQGATKNEIIVPVAAAGKNIFIEAKTEDGLVFVSENKIIQNLQLNMADLVIEGFSKGEDDLVVPGDILKVKAPTVKTNVGSTENPKEITLNPDQITYSYQWLYKAGDNYSVIPNATTDSYTIPKDAMDSSMNQIVVKVTAKVGNETVSKIESKPIIVSDKHITPLIQEINNLLSTKDKKVTYIEEVRTKASSLQETYQSLTPAAKSQVTNYSILQRALADIEKVDKIAGKISSLDENSSQQQLQALKAEYDQLDYLQRSLDKENAYEKLLKQLIENPDSMKELTKLREINAKIIDLLDSNLISVPTYKVTTTTELDALIQNIEKEINTLSNDYKAAVQNREILTMAKADVKNAQKFEKLFDKLKGQTAQQKVTTAKNIRTAYLKLSLRQQGLVDSKLNELEDAENAESSAIAEIEDLINKLKEPVDAESWNKYVADVNSIISKQKSLKSFQDVASKNKFIQIQNDLKLAEKVITQIKKYESLNPDTKNATLQSTYNSALKAFNKLTINQQKYVYNQDILKKAPENNGNTSPSDSDDATAGEAFNAKIKIALDTSTDDFAVYAAKIEEVSNEYKNVSPKARKYVTNYSDLKTAETNIKAVRSYEKKVNDALINKGYSKMQDAVKAYNKLNAIQQKLAAAFYSKVNDAINQYTSSNNDLNEQLANIKKDIEDNKYSLTLEEVKKTINDYNALSSAEKKLIENGQVIKQATSDVKAIESFIKKFNSNIDKNPSTIVKDFQKLTSLQVSLLDGNTLTKINELETSGQTANDIALKIIESINDLQKNGYYVENLEVEVTKIIEDYNKLTSAQKNLVKNYSKLTQAESDLQKVKAVEELKADTEAWQKAYNKLTKKLEQLYEDRNK
ncbi:hypothetical protein ACQKNC_01490 [Lysinibacillus sp. NPDC094177]|uniref:hypothetical protein n=1 Tax=Lysinibacillus sp. NPDC094177 TaxID=3390580 RepID=UPI003CFFC03C